MQPAIAGSWIGDLLFFKLLAEAFVRECWDIQLTYDSEFVSYDKKHLTHGNMSGIINMIG
jgi:hypothetical protein